MSKLRKSSDYVLALVTLSLSIFGIIFLYSAGSVLAENVFHSPYYFVERQVIAFIIGLFLLIIISQINFAIFRKLALPFLILAILLMMPLSFHLVKPISGVYRWYDLGFFAFQPSEFLKLALIVYFAALFEDEKRAKDFLKGSLPFFAILTLVALLIIREPDLGSLVVIFLTMLILFLIAGARLSHLLIAGVTLGVLLSVFAFSAPYRLARIEAFLNPSRDVRGIGYHSNQALIAIGTGGLLGKGFGQSIQKHFYLPEPHTDSIFAVLVEELGALRASLVIVAFLVFAWRGFKAAGKSEDRFASLLATGLVSKIIVEAFINLSAMMRLLPLTGITLPFVSYGGSNLLFNLVCVGIILSVSKYTKR